MRWTLIQALLLGLISGVFYLSTPAARSSKSSQPCLAALLSTLVVSDFDNDDRPDLAISEHQTRGYKIETQLSRRRERVSFSLPSDEPQIELLSFDVDRDHDQDLIIMSVRSLNPIAVWLNDGRGHFKSSRRRMPVRFFTDDNQPGYNQPRDEADQVFSNANGQHPWNKSTLRLAEPTLEGSTPSDWQQLSFRLLTYKLPVRSPPLGLTA